MGGPGLWGRVTGVEGWSPLPCTPQGKPLMPLPLQVTMADRAAAERACKDPNPNIDGRKANVNLAYLGAKPRSLHSGERLLPFPGSCRLLLFSLPICLVTPPCPALPCPTPPQEWQSAVMCLQSHHRTVMP